MKFSVCCLWWIPVLILIGTRDAASEELLELSCLTASQCRQFERQGVEVDCVEERCQCSNPVTGERIKCRPTEHMQSNFIGGSCPCTLPHAQCNAEQDVCYCAEDYAPSADRRRCLQRRVDLGGECETNAQCHAPYAECNATTNKCLCSEGFIQHDDDLCLAMLQETFDTCSNDTQCQTLDPGAFCSPTASVCLCPVEYVSSPDGKSCVKVSDFQDKCTETKQCLLKLGNFATCHDGACVCGDNYSMFQEQLANGTMSVACKPHVARGSYCRRDPDCYEYQLPETDQTLVCMYGECNCKHGFISINNGNCTRGSSASLNEPWPLLTLILSLASVFGYVPSLQSALAAVLKFY